MYNCGVPPQELVPITLNGLVLVDRWTQEPTRETEYWRLDRSRLLMLDDTDVWYRAVVELTRDMPLLKWMVSKNSNVFKDTIMLIIKLLFKGTIMFFNLKKKHTKKLFQNILCSSYCEWCLLSDYIVLSKYHWILDNKVHVYTFSWFRRTVNLEDLIASAKICHTDPLWHI